MQRRGGNAPPFSWRPRVRRPPRQNLARGGPQGGVLVEAPCFRGAECLLGHFQQSAEMSRRKIDGSLELPGEVTLVGEAAAIRNVGDFERRGRQELLGLVDPDSAQHGLKCLPGLGSQTVHERGSAGPCGAGRRRQGDTFLIVGL